MSKNHTRMQIVIESLREQNRSGLIVYLIAGDPDFETSLALLDAAAQADLIEIGMPFSDPVADGEILQKGNARALENGQTLQKTLDLLKQLRLRNNLVPVVLMGYLNPIHLFGIESFMNEAANSGADALLIVDLPYEMASTFRKAATKHGLVMIQMIAPTADKERLKMVLNNAKGFVYQVGYNGTTGTKSLDVGSTQELLSKTKMYTNLPIAVGFGIKNPEQAVEVAKFSDFVIVGSELVRLIHDGNSEGMVSRCRDAVTNFKKAICEARSTSSSV